MDILMGLWQLLRKLPSIDSTIWPFTLLPASLFPNPTHACFTTITFLIQLQVSSPKFQPIFVIWITPNHFPIRLSRRHLWAWQRSGLTSASNPALRPRPCAEICTPQVYTVDWLVY